MSYYRKDKLHFFLKHKMLNVEEYIPFLWLARVYYLFYKKDFSLS